MKPRKKQKTETAGSGAPLVLGTNLPELDWCVDDSVSTDIVFEHTYFIHLLLACTHHISSQSVIYTSIIGERRLGTTSPLAAPLVPLCPLPPSLPPHHVDKPPHPYTHISTLAWLMWMASRSSPPVMTSSPG